VRFDPSPGHNDARLAASLARLDSGSGFAVINLYDGVAPSPGGSPASSLLLVEIVLPKPSGEIVSNSLSLFVSPLAIIINSGVARWARWIDGNSQWFGDSDVTDSAGDGFIRIPDTTLYAGGKTQVLGGTIV